MDAFLRDLGVERYYGKFKAQGIDDVSDAKTLNNKQLDVVLEKIGMDCNPGHVSKFKKGLAAHTEKREREEDDDDDNNSKKNKKSNANPSDPAAVVRLAMAAARARGGGVVGGGEATKAANTLNASSGLLTQGKTTPASEEEILNILKSFRCNDFLNLFGFPGAPVDNRGKCEWKHHPVSKAGDVAVKSKLLSIKLDPGLNGAHALAGEAQKCVLEAAKILDDKEQRKEILTVAVRKRVMEMRSKNIGDVHGGYISMTGVHYAAGAAAAQVNDYAPEANGEGPAMNPAARLVAGTAAVKKVNEGIDESARLVAHTDGDDVKGDTDVHTTVHAQPVHTKPSGTSTTPKVDLGSIRDKLKKKKKVFM